MTLWPHSRFLICQFFSISLAFAVHGAERVFDFSEVAENQTPPGFRSVMSGGGKPGDWRVVFDKVAPTLPGSSAVSTVKPVLAQLSNDPTDERFPMFIYEGESYSDFTFTARFKTVRGTAEQMAGLVFRVQNPTNYYVVRASTLGNTLRFYKVVNGERGQIIGISTNISSGAWHDLGVECKGTQIRCFLDGQQVIPTLTDSTFAIGKVGFWTKSDSVSYFCDAKVVYTPKELPAQIIVRDLLNKYPKLLGINVYAPMGTSGAPQLVASKTGKDANAPVGSAEREVLLNGQTFYGKSKDSISVTMPIRDHNGDIIATVKIIMKTFPGQTEKSALERAAPIVRQIRDRVQTREDLVL